MKSKSILLIASAMLLAACGTQNPSSSSSEPSSSLSSSESSQPSSSESSSQVSSSEESSSESTSSQQTSSSREESSESSSSEESSTEQSSEESSEQSSESSSGEESSSEQTSSEESSSEQSSEESSEQSSESSSSEESSSEQSSSEESSTEQSSEESSEQSSESSEESSESSSSIDLEVYRELRVTGSEHITAEFYLDPKAEEPEPVFYAKRAERLYIKIVPTDPENPDYGLKKATISWTDADSYSSKSEDITNSKSADYEGYLTFAMPNVEKGTSLTLTLVDRDLTLFKDAPFVGTYYGLDYSCFHGRDVTGFENSRYTEILASGDVSVGYPTAKATGVVDSYDKESGLVSLSYGSIYADGKLLFADSDLKPIFYSGSYFYCGIKKAESTDRSSDYQAYGESITINGNWYYFAEVYRKGEYYDGLYVDFSAKKVTFGVEYAFSNGSHITDARAIYEVKKDGETLTAIGSGLEDGAAGRILVSSPYGHYQAGEKEVFLDGNGNATYDGTDFTYTIEEGVVHLVGTIRSVDLTLNEENKTATILKDEEATVEETPAFMGKTYYGTFYDSWWETNDNFTIRFDEKESVFYSGTSASTSIHYLNGSQNYSRFCLDPVAYEYDASTGLLTAQVIDCQHKEAGFAFSLTYSVVSDTFTINVNCGNFEMKGRTLSPVA